MNFQNFLNGNSALVTTIWVVVIMSFFVVFLMRLLIAKKDSQKLKENRITFESRAATLSTLGVLGTFFGITWGLMGFNADDLDNSIPILLGGLKTAFFTSLAGMICSLVYNAILNHIYDVFEASLPSSQDESVAKICDAITKMSDSSTNAIETIKTQLTTAQNNQTAFYTAALSSLNGLNKEYLDSLKEEVKGIMNSILLQTTAVSTQLKPLESVNNLSSDVKSITSAISEISGNVSEQFQENKTFGTTLGEIGRAHV